MENSYAVWRYAIGEPQQKMSICRKYLALIVQPQLKYLLKREPGKKKYTIALLVIIVLAEGGNKMFKYKCSLCKKETTTISRQEYRVLVIKIKNAVKTITKDDPYETFSAKIIDTELKRLNVAVTNNPYFCPKCGV